MSWAPRALCAALALAAVPSTAHAAWQEVPGGASPINHANNFDAQAGGSLVTIGGVPWIARPEFNASGHTVMRVSRLNRAGTAWDEPVGGANPISQDANRDSTGGSLADVAGGPWLAWTESDGTNDEVRVSRLNSAGTAWDQVGGGASPINQAPNRSASTASLAAVGGVPYVAWAESDGSNREIRVSRPNGSGTAWQQVVGGASPINDSPTADAQEPSVASVGGVPWVAWDEFDGVRYQIRVSKLSASGTVWQQVVSGASPINHDPTMNAGQPSMASVGGVPYVTWIETDGTNFEVRVSRLNAAGTAWQEVGGGASPINQADDGAATDPHLADIAGVPYVAWRENSPPLGSQLRVARMNADGTGWDQVVGGESPINADELRSASPEGITGVGGVPYVGWVEFDGTNIEARVARLEPEISRPETVAADSGAVLLARARTFGVAYPITFEYGPGGSLANRTQVAPSDGLIGSDTVHATIGGLAPSTAYSQRALGFDGARDIAPGPVTQFTTGAAPAPQVQTQVETQVQTVIQTQTSTITRLLVAVVNPKLKARAGKRVSVAYLSTGTGAATLEALKGRKRVARVTAAAKAGRNAIAWNGKDGRTKAKPGRYALKLSVTGGDGQTATDGASVTVQR